jgi:hypothetical protein
MAQIQIWTRDVNSTEFFFGNYTPQHTFLIKVNDDGTREILRGGPIEDDMLLGDVEIINQDYNGPENNGIKTLDWYNPSLPNTQNFQYQTIKTSSQSEIDTLWNSALASKDAINSQLYDYDPLTQNCNTVTSFLARVMGLEAEVNEFLSEKKLYTPGLGNEFDASPIDQVWDSFEQAMKYGVKSYLNSLSSDAKVVSSYVLSSFNSLFTSESTTSIPAPRRVDPLTLDLDGDGVELIAVNNSTAFFDLDVTPELDANGNPTGNYLSDGVKEQVGWVSGDDGLLTLDKNNNGTIDNILELFGKTDKTGTEELREYDLNKDGVINSNDTVFSNLKIWQDHNQNGISESSELKTLSELGITSINVSPESLTPKNEVKEGSLIISEGTYTQNITNADGSVSEVTKSYSNLDLAVNQSNSLSYTYTDSEGNVIGDYDLNLDVLSLPMSRGYGRERRRFISGKTQRVLSERGKRSKATRSQARVVFERSEKSDEVLSANYF